MMLVKGVHCSRTASSPISGSSAVRPHCRNLRRIHGRPSRPLLCQLGRCCLCDGPLWRLPTLPRLLACGHFQAAGSRPSGGHISHHICQPSGSAAMLTRNIQPKQYHRSHGCTAELPNGLQQSCDPSRIHGGLHVHRCVRAPGRCPVHVLIL